MHLYWRFARPMTLGVRAIVQNEDKEIFLVRHTYVRGWHLPGGGVEAGETVFQAVEKELFEEANITLKSVPDFLTIFKNQHASKRDHVALFYINNFEQRSLPEPNSEIAESGWFAVDALPPGTTPATQRRIRELVEDIPNDHYW